MARASSIVMACLGPLRGRETGARGATLWEARWGRDADCVGRENLGWAGDSLRERKRRAGRWVRAAAAGLMCGEVT